MKLLLQKKGDAPIPFATYAVCDFTTILDDFRNNKRDRVPVWMEKNGKPFLVTYMAVRDKKGNYLGTVEVVQDMQFAKEHFEK